MTIIIEVINFDGRAQEKILYRNSIILHDDLSIDFDSLYKSLKLLYPKSSFINFKISTK